MAGQLPLVPLPLARARSAGAADGDARNVRQRVEMPPAPTPASLAAMPPQVVEVLVEQAALAARDAPNPPEAICEWMKAFCVASGARACPDDLFRRALAAWGFVPEEKAARETVLRSRDPAAPGTYVNLRGEPVPAPAEMAPPAWAGFDTWRVLFGQLCEAWYGRLSRPHDDYVNPFREPGSMWLHAAWRLGEPHRWGDPQPNQADVDRTKARFLNPDMSQREKDTLVDALLTNAERVAGGVTDEQWHSVDQGDWDNHRENYRDHLLKNWWHDFRWGDFASNDSWFGHESAPWRAVLALLVLRGGRVTMPGYLSWDRPMKYYERRDRILYRLLVRVQRREDELNEERLKDVRLLLEEMGANPNPNQRLLEWLPQPILPAGDFITPYPPPLIVAIYARSGPLVKLLLEFGATSSFVGPHGLMTALLGRPAALGNLYAPGWTVDEEDTLQLLGTLREEVEQLDRDSRAARYDDAIRAFVDRYTRGVVVPRRILAAVEALLGPGPTPA